MTLTQSTAFVLNQAKTYYNLNLTSTYYYTAGVSVLPKNQNFVLSPTLLRPNRSPLSSLKWLWSGVQVPSLSKSSLAQDPFPLCPSPSPSLPFRSLHLSFPFMSFPFSFLPPPYHPLPFFFPPSFPYHFLLLSLSLWKIFSSLCTITFIFPFSSFYLFIFLCNFSFL